MWQVLTTAYARLGFDMIDDEKFKHFVLARVIEPTSRVDTVRALDEIGVPAASLRTMFRSLHRTPERDYRDQIATAYFAHAATEGDVSLVLYDVTTLYLEAENEDEFRKVGYSKERGVNPQVVVGLLVYRAGFPLEIGCFEGNKAETATIVPIVEQFQQRHQIANVIVVADAGKLSLIEPRDLGQGGLEVHRRVPSHEGAQGSGVPFPLARHRLHRRTDHRHHHAQGPARYRPATQ